MSWRCLSRRMFVRWKRFIKISYIRAQNVITAFQYWRLRNLLEAVGHWGDWAEHRRRNRLLSRLARDHYASHLKRRCLRRWGRFTVETYALDAAETCWSFHAARRGLRALQSNIGLQRFYRRRCLKMLRQDQLCRALLT